MIRIQGFHIKNIKKITAENYYFFLLRNYNLPNPRPLYKTSKLQKSLQLSKRASSILDSENSENSENSEISCFYIYVKT